MAEPRIGDDIVFAHGGLEKVGRCRIEGPTMARPGLFAPGADRGRLAIPDQVTDGADGDELGLHSGVLRGQPIDLGSAGGKTLFGGGQDRPPALQVRRLGNGEAGERTRIAGPGPQRAQALVEFGAVLGAGALGEAAPGGVVVGPQRRERCGEKRHCGVVLGDLRPVAGVAERGLGFVEAVARRLVLRERRGLPRFDAGALFDEVAQLTDDRGSEDEAVRVGFVRPLDADKNIANLEVRFAQPQPTLREVPVRRGVPRAEIVEAVGLRRQAQGARVDDDRPDLTFETPDLACGLLRPRRQLDLGVAQPGQIVRPTRRRGGEVGEGNQAVRISRSSASRGRAASRRRRSSLRASSRPSSAFPVS